MSVAWNFYWKLIFFVLQCTLVKIACFLFLFKSCGLFFIFILPITHLREIELFPLSRSLWALKILFLHVVSVEWNAFLIKTVYKLQGCWLSCQTSLLNLFQYPWWSLFVDFFPPDSCWVYCPNTAMPQLCSCHCGNKAQRETCWGSICNVRFVNFLFKTNLFVFKLCWNILKVVNWLIRNQRTLFFT